jgi:hypothetical protein
MRRVPIALMTSLLAVSISATVAAFETPEAAVREYVEGVAHADIQKVLEASAIDEMTEGYRFERMVERLGAYTPTVAGPVHSPFFAGVEQANWTSQLLRQARMFAYSLLAAETLGAGLEYNPLPDVDSAWADGLIAELEEARLDGLVVADIKLPEPEMYNRTINLELMARNAAVFGADEATDRVALVLFEGDTYLVGFGLLRYGDDWTVQRQSSPLGSTPSSGAATPMSASEFSELTSE